jgi:hypothetical protein
LQAHPGSSLQIAVLAMQPLPQDFSLPEQVLQQSEPVEDDEQPATTRMATASRNFITSMAFKDIIQPFGVFDGTLYVIQI